MLKIKHSKEYSEVVRQYYVDIIDYRSICIEYNSRFVHNFIRVDVIHSIRVDVYNTTCLPC